MKSSNNKITSISERDELTRQFEYVNSLIERHRFSAITKVNIEVLMTSWEVGEYISIQLKTSHWGSKVVSELADYLKLQNPQRRGFGKRHLYNMVKFYDLYSRVEFSEMIKILHLSEIVQSSIAQLGYIEKVDRRPLKSSITLLAIPELLLLIPFTSHLEIMNRCNTDEERIFYMLYASQQSLRTEELRRCIVNQTYASLMNRDKMLSPKLLSEYPKTEFMLKDKAFVDFLNLPEVHNEQHLHKGLLEHIKDFILELGKDFLFVESEFRVQVGGTTKRIDLLFYHRALQCLVAIELKTVDFQPEFIGKMDLYLEALDRDVKRDNENPSIGIILCPSADRSIVEYTLSRSLSPTMVAEYRRKLIPIDVMRKSLEEYCEFLNNR
ncbi:MAG: DUF1016 domain-containing protein [Lentimicrobiaceae bacterium]|nr:DUF1016 domain-containing protein [Lentimicrobiaceae bacterium]